MDTDRCRRAAERIDAWMRHCVGIGVEPARMLDDALYARDVLLVCDAHRGTAMAELAACFRRARDEPVAATAAGPGRRSGLASGFGVPGWLGSWFGTDRPPVVPPPLARLLRPGSSSPGPAPPRR